MPSAPSSSPAAKAALIRPAETDRITERSSSSSSSSGGGSSGSHQGNTATHQLTQPHPIAGSSHGKIPRGRHITLDFYKIPGHHFSAVANPKTLARTASELIQRSAMTLLGHSCHVFRDTGGITCVFLLSESHLSIHTWPEHGYAGAHEWQL